MQRRQIYTVCLLIFVIGVMACSISGQGAPPAETLRPAFSIECMESSKPVTPGEIEVFLFSLRFTDSLPAVVEVSLESLQAPGWEAALCYETHCYMHDGQEKLVEKIELSAGTEFEIKLFVPDTAQSQASNTLRVAISSEQSPRQSVSIDLNGYVP